MTVEEINNIACQIIAFAGDAKSSFLVAIDTAENGDLEEAESIKKEGDDAIIKAHEIHTQLLVSEAKDPESIKMTMMLVHASNHLTAAEVTQNFCEKLLNLYKNKGDN